MKKVNEKLLHLVRIYWHKPLIMTKLCILFLICSMTLFRQIQFLPMIRTLFSRILVTGTVKDAATGEALIGVSVMVKGTTLGRLTDANGKFSIRILQRKRFFLSFIGYTTQEIAVTQGSKISVAMQLEVTQISEGCGCRVRHPEKRECCRSYYTGEHCSTREIRYYKCYQCNCRKTFGSIDDTEYR